MTTEVEVMSEARATVKDTRPKVEDVPITHIRASKGGAPLNLRELWQYRELLYFLTMRNIKIRYKQTVLGAAWAVLQPFFTMLIFSVFFGRLAGVPSDGVPYPVWAFCGLVPWTFFSTALVQGSNSVVEHEAVITKVYFPRLMVPMAAVLMGLLDLAIAFVVLLGIMLFYGIVPTIAAVTLPLFVLLATMTAVGVTLWLSALNVQYRDVRLAIPFLVQIWLFASPIAYPSSIVPEAWRVLYGLNPMVGVVEGFRWALFGKGEAPGLMMAVSVLIVFVVLLSALYYFRRMERTFADVV